MTLTLTPELQSALYKNVFLLFNCSHREQVSKRRMKDIVKEFSLLSRGLQGTEYAVNY